MPVVEKVSEVLARGAPSALVAPRDRVRPRRVEADRMALSHRLQVGPPPAGWRCGAVPCPRGLAAGLQHRQQLTLLDSVADGDREAAQHAVDLGEDLVLHLHRLEHHQRRARSDLGLLAHGIETTTPANGAITDRGLQPLSDHR